MYTELVTENFVGAWWVVPVAGLLASIVSISICACCKKSTGFEHKASIIRNSTRRTDDQTQEVPEKEAAVVGRWDCLIDIDDLDVKPPEKFIPPEKLKRLSMAPKAPPPDLLPSSHLTTLRYHDRSRKDSKESARQARSLYITDQPPNTESTSPTFNLPKRHSSFFEYKKFDSPSKPTSKTSSPPPLFDHYDVRMSSPSQLQQQRQSIDSDATEKTSISALSMNNQKTKKENQMRFSPPPIFEGRREETPLDIEVYTPPPIPPRNYLFLENEGPDDEPVILQSSPSSLKERYRNYRNYNVESSPNNTSRYQNELPGFKLYRPEDGTRPRSNYISQNFPLNGIAVRYHQGDSHVIRRPPAIRVDTEYHRHQHMRGIDNHGYVRYSDEARVHSQELDEDGFVRLRRHPDDVYRNSYENRRRRMNEHRYSMEYDGYRVPLRRSPYDRERLVDRPQRFSSFISEDYDDLWRVSESTRREVPVFREPQSKSSSIPDKKSQEKLEAPIPKPRMLRRSTVGDITMQGEERKHDSDDDNETIAPETQKSKNENNKKSLRIKIYEQLKDESAKKLDNLEVIIDKILDVIHDPDVGARELKQEANETESETQLTSNDQHLRQRSSSLPDAPSLANYSPVENQLQSQSGNKNEENEDKMLKRFKGNFEDKNDQKRRKRAGSGRRSLKKSSTKPSEKSTPPEVVKVTVLPVVNNSRDVLNKLEEQTNNEIKSLERLQIENDQHKISKSHDDIFRDVEMQSSESSWIKTNSNLDLPVAKPRSSSPSFKTKLVSPIPQRSNLPFVNRQYKNRQTVNSGTSMRVRSATPPVAMDISPKLQERNAKRFSVHGTVFSSPRSPNLSVNNKPKLKESKSSEGKLSSGSMRRVSRTGEIVRIPAEDEYSIPYDCVVTQPAGSGLASPTYSIPLSDMDRPPRSPASNHSSGMSNLGSNWSVNGRVTPRTPESGRFNFGSRELGGIIESGYINSDNDDYDYADPIN